MNYTHAEPNQVMESRTEPTPPTATDVSTATGKQTLVMQGTPTIHTQFAQRCLSSPFSLSVVQWSRGHDDVLYGGTFVCEQNWLFDTSAKVSPCADKMKRHGAFLSPGFPADLFLWASHWL